MKVKVINKSKHNLPQYETENSAGMDIKANFTEGMKKIVLPSLGRTLVKTGLFLELPAGYEAQIRPRSGLAIKKGITVLNSPGTIDADYRGEIGVILVNLSHQPFTINDGDRIAQMVFAEVKQAEWVPTDILTQTSRGEGGFGSTGVKTEPCRGYDSETEKE